MSLKLQRQIDIQRKEIDKLNKKVEWLIREMKSGLKDVIERVIAQNIEIDISDGCTTKRQEELKLLRALEEESN